MHELSIVTNVLDAAVGEAKRKRAKKLLAVNLKVGVYKQVVDDALQFSWHLLADDDDFSEGAKLNVDYIEPYSVCPECGHEFEHDMFHRSCTKCGCKWTTLVRGSELEISSIEVSES